MTQIILASASPRRKELLEQQGLTFEIMPADIDETLRPGLPPREAAADLARRKAEAAEGIARGRGIIGVIIAADTIVLSDNEDGTEEVIGKPDDDLHAFSILKRLSGSEHSVVTGLCVLDMASGRELTGWDETRLAMREMSDDEIAAYVATGEASGKAGAYGLQDNDPNIESLSGSISNVLGLPIELLVQYLAKLGVET